MDTDGNASSESLGSDIDVDAIIDANDRSLRGAVDFGDDYFNRNTLEQATELIRRELRAHPESSTAAFDAMLRDPVGRRILQDEVLVARLCGILATPAVNTEPEPPPARVQSCTLKSRWHIFSGVAVGLVASFLIAAIFKHGSRG